MMTAGQGAAVPEPDPASLKLLFVQGTLKQVQKLLGEAGIQVIVLKGVHLGSTVYDDARQRTFCDVDLLVRPGYFDRAVIILKEANYRQTSAAEGRSATEDAFYCFGFTSPQGVHFELHRELAGYGRYPVDIEGLFQRAKIFNMGNTAALGLSAEDLLCHLCVHISKSYFLTLEAKHFRDIALLIDRMQVDWPTFLERVQEARCRVGSYYSLKASLLLHCARVPEAVLESLYPNTLRRWYLGFYLDPSKYPVYRFPNHTPLQYQTRVGLPLIDRVRDWPVILSRYAKVRLMDVVRTRASRRKGAALGAHV